MATRTQLLRAIFEQGVRTPDWRHKQPPPVVSLELFFDENNDDGSIAANLDEHPGVAFFYEALKRIRDGNDVKEVLVNIYDMDATIAGGWPYAENVHVLTSAPEATVQSWAAELRSDGAFEGWPYGKAAAAPDDEAPYKWWSLAWD